MPRARVARRLTCGLWPVGVSLMIAATVCSRAPRECAVRIVIRAASCCALPTDKDSSLIDPRFILLLFLLSAQEPNEVDL